MSETFDHTAIRVIAQQLYRSGHETEAKQLTVLAQAMNQAQARLSTGMMHDFRVLSPRAWAEANGFPAVEHPMDDGDGDLYLDEGLLPSWRAAAAAWQAKERQPLLSIAAARATVTTIGWALHGQTGQTCDEQFDVLSPAGDFLCYDPYWLPWLAHKGVFGCIAVARQRLMMDFSGSDEASLPPGSILVTSRSNWSHWLLDHLSRVRIAVPRPGRKAVFGPLRPSQRRCLPYVGIDPADVVEVEVRCTRLIRHAAEDLTVLSPVPKKMAFSWLRDRFTARRAADGPRRVYLSRWRQRPRHRVDNDVEVSALLEARGFRTVHIETLEFADQLAVLAHAEVIVMSLGGDIGNLALCNPAATVVMLTSRLYAETPPPEQACREIAAYVFGCGLPVVPVYGEPLTPEDRSLDAPAVYAPAVVDAAVDRALALARQRSS